MDIIVPFDQLGKANPGPWQNAAPSSSIPGSIPNADFFSTVLGELLNLQDGAGIQRDANNHAQLLQAVRGGKLTTFADQSNSPNTIVITPPVPFTGILPLQSFRVVPNFYNTAVDVTLVVNNLPFAVRKQEGAKPAPGDIKQGVPVDVTFDGTYFRLVPLTISDITSLTVVQQIFNIAQQLVAPLPNIVDIQGQYGVFTRAVFNKGYTLTEGYIGGTASGGILDFTLPVAFPDEKFSVLCQDTNNKDTPGPGIFITCYALSGSTVRVFTRNVADGTNYNGPVAFHYIAAGHN